MATKKQPRAWLGSRVVALRKQYGMSQKELADAIGVKVPSLWEIERGITKDPASSTLIKLATTLRADPFYLHSGLPIANRPADGIGQLSAFELRMVEWMRALDANQRLAFNAALAAVFGGRRKT